MNQKDIHKEALDELQVSYYWYSENAGYDIAERFLDEFFDTLKNVKESPAAWSVREHGCRQVNMSKFPFGLIYVIREKTIFLIAVTHFIRFSIKEYIFTLNEYSEITLVNKWFLAITVLFSFFVVPF